MRTTPDPPVRVIMTIPTREPVIFDERGPFHKI